MTTTEKIAPWLQNLIDMAMMGEALPLASYAERASKASDVVHQVLTHRWPKVPNAEPITLGSNIMVIARAYALQIRNEPSSFPNLEEYFATVAGMLEAVHALVLSNRANFGNKALIAHLKEVTNTVLVCTGAMFVLNAFFTQHYPDPDDDDEPPTPRVG